MSSIVRNGPRLGLTASALLFAAGLATSAPVFAQQAAIKKYDLDIYGFVMADTIYDFKRVDPDWNDTLRVSTIPTNEGEYGGDGEFVMSVRQSRMGISAKIPTNNGDVSALLEWEWFGTGGDAGQTTPRLRHAWGTWKSLGAGQYWSNFMDADVFPNTIDYWGPTGMIFYRNKQVRYSVPMGEDELSFSIEDPDTALTVGRFRDESSCDLPGAPVGNCGSTISEVFQADNDVPDFTARYRDNTSWGHWQIAGIARKLGYERIDNGNSDYEFGWGFNASSVIKMFERDQLKLQLAYGEGIGNYFNDGGLDLAPDSADLENASATAVPILGIVAYYDHYWSEKWSSTIGWSMTDLDTEDGQADDEFKKGQIASTNLLWYPTDHVMTGLEFSWGQREDVDGEDGTDYRIQFSLKVNFSLKDAM
ncbi:MAG: DcaP family trimeric outer membrane transporter [Gammaproteobacteria bacterium]